jgi:hypothetical protein
MWRITKNKDPSRGGFQDRDAGRSNMNRDFGPDLGVDYARYSDPPDLAADAALSEKVRDKVERIYLDVSMPVTFHVRNGFVFLKGEVPDEAIREEIREAVTGLYGVTEVVNQLKVVKLH